MLESETKLMLRFGRAYRMLEAWIEADILESTRGAMIEVFGSAPEFKLAKVLSTNRDAISLSGTR